MMRSPTMSAGSIVLLLLGGSLASDEVMILDRPLTSERLAEYVTAMRQMKSAYVPG